MTDGWFNTHERENCIFEPCFRVVMAESQTHQMVEPSFMMVVMVESPTHQWHLLCYRSGSNEELI